MATTSRCPCCRRTRSPISADASKSMKPKRESRCRAIWRHKIAPAVHLGRRTRAPPEDRRCGRGHFRPRPSVLDHEFLHQGGQKPRVRVVAPGRVLLGPRSRRRGDGVGRAVARQSRERMHEIPAGLADAGPSPARRHLPQGQPALARTGNRGRGRRARSGGLHPQARRDVAASRQAGAWLRAEPVERPAHRLGHPLHPDLRAADQGARLGDACARRRHATATSTWSRGRSATSTRRRWRRMPMPSAGR